MRSLYNKPGSNPCTHKSRGDSWAKVSIAQQPWLGELGLQLLVCLGEAGTERLEVGHCLSKSIQKPPVPGSMQDPGGALISLFLFWLLSCYYLATALHNCKLPGLSQLPPVLSPTLSIPLCFCLCCLQPVTHFPTFSPNLNLSLQDLTQTPPPHGKCSLSFLSAFHTHCIGLFCFF